MNIDMKLWASTTSSHMTANCSAVAMHPIVGTTVVVEGEPPIKVGWVFVSDDLQHDATQVTINQTIKTNPKLPNFKKFGFELT